jgi:uncharacterized Zn-binding protein involved in type VI secretion
MSRSGDPARCPDGHENSVKLLSTVALAGAPVAASGDSGGGCCGGGCCG